MKSGHLRKVIVSLTIGVILSGGCLIGVSNATNTSATEENMKAISLLESVRQNYYANQRLESLRSSNSVNIKRDIPARMWFKKVNANEVNMVTNRFTGDHQDAISVNGKTYFANGEGYAINMRQNSSLRYTKDPVTNKPIDKAEAITYSDASGRVIYFESEMSFERFVGLANSETQYGYSK